MEDDSRYFDFEPEDGWNSMDYISGMNGRSRLMMMDVVYSSIINNEYGVINSLSKKDLKLSALKHVLEFFEELEQYEKCAELKRVIDKIK